MSRHKLVKSMNLNDELDDFDGGEAYDDDEETGGDALSPEDKGNDLVAFMDKEALLRLTFRVLGTLEQLEIGTASVRSILGPEVPVTDKTIQESLWHYYYDVDKTVTYLLNQQHATKSKKSKKEAYNGGPMAKEETMLQRHQRNPFDCLEPFSAKEFFKDSPWLNIPLYRRGEIVIEPLYSGGGLLGGAPADATPKVSKLAALAAARKKKENEKSGGDDSKSVNTSAALLDKLYIRGASHGNDQHSKEETNGQSIKRSKGDAVEPSIEGPKTKTNLKYSKRIAKDSTPFSPPLTEIDEQPVTMEEYPEEPPPIFAAPSSFARTMFGSSLSTPSTDAMLTAPLTTFGPVYASGITVTDLEPFAGPSPDDIVANAQKASKGSKSSKSKAKGDTDTLSVKGVIDGISKVAMNDTPSAKSKILDVVAEFRNTQKKNAANFVVIGHVDAGKSTLMGRLLYDLGVVDQRTIDRYRKEAEKIGKSSFALAWVLDQGTEERNRGVTIDIAMNKFETYTTSFTILDAPGHRDFIPNMIAGASQADFAVLVIDASTGSFESGLKGQTKEHALLVRSMGVQRLVVAINKLDTVSWSRTRFEEIQQQVSMFLTVSGFQSKNVCYVPCSGLTGANIATRATDPDASWYTGPILIEQLENSEPVTRSLEKPLRLTISDVFRGGVQNPLSVSGRIDAGSIQVGDKVLAVPSGETAYIRALDVDSEPADWAVAGQNVILHLSDIDAVHLKAGDVICPPSAPVKSVKSFTVKILAFEHVTPMYVDIHRGRLHAPGRVTQLNAVLDKGSGATLKKKPRLVKPGDVARIVVEVDVEGGVPLEAPGRVVLRAGGETVAAGLLE